MSGAGDDERGDRPKLSWSELDKRRGKARSHTDERRPRGAAAEALAAKAAQSYLKKLDQQLFAKGGKSASAASKLADAVRDALGPPALDDACRAYLAEAGGPATPPLVAAFLDAHDRALRVASLEALGEAGAAADIVLTPGLRSQLRGLAEGSDDELAERAEAILARARAKD
jgi:hypothetical protein